MSDTLTIPETAAHLGISEEHARRLARRGKLERVPTIDKAARVTRASVEAYAAQRQRGRPRQDIDEVGERQRQRRKGEAE